MTTEQPTTDQPTPSPVTRRRPLRRIACALGRLSVWIIAIGLIIWAILAVYFANTSVGSPRTVRAVLLAMMLIASVFIRPRKYGRIAFAVLWLGVLGWYLSIRASNDRDWSPDVARTATFDVNGDLLTVHNVRDFDWRSDDDFTARWSDRKYRLSDLRSVDILLCRWGSKAIAHGMISFGFADGQHLCASIETRKERSEKYSAVQGFFRQYELIYVFADEHDIVRVRTNCRNEEVYLFRTSVRPDKARELLMNYARHANSLAAEPQFYNALTSNCVTNIIYIARVVNPSVRISWEVLLSGYAARVAYRNGRLDHSMPYDELEAKSLISPLAKSLPDDADFSKAIRAGLPDPLQPSTQPSTP